MARQPLHALRQRLRMRIHPGYRVERDILGQQILHDPQLDLADDRKRRLAHEIECATHGALGRILDRHDSVIGAPTLAGAEHLVDRAAGLGDYGIAEMTHDRGVAIRAGRSQIRHRHLLLQRETSRHDLAKDAAHRGIRQRSAVLCLHAAKHLRFTLRPVRRTVLERADRLRVPGAFGDKPQQLAIENVDGSAVALQLRSFVAVLIVGHGSSAGRWVTVTASLRFSTKLAARGVARYSPFSSSVSTTRSSPASFSPSPRLISVTPCVERPISRIAFTGVRINTPPVEINMTSSSGRTSAAATTCPLRPLCWIAIMPFVPRPWRVYSTMGVRLP